MKPDFKEIDIENFIWKSISTGTLEKRGLSLSRGIYYRQVNLVGCGVMDIVGIQIGKTIYDGVHHPFIRVSIYELKRNQITCNDLGQISRYCDCVESNSLILTGKMGLPDAYSVHVRGCLVGAGIERDAYHALMYLRGSHIIDAMQYRISFENGIIFEQINEDSSLPQIQFSELPNINFRSLARSSYPLIEDFTPKQKLSADGEAATDGQSSFSVPF